MNTENLSTLKIHKLSKTQYERELAAGRIDENAIYLTPDEAIDLSGYATIDHSHTASDITSGTFLPDILPIVPVTKGGTGATDAATARDNLGVTKLYASMVPYGTSISANANLNTATYLKVGNYYCGSDSTADSVQNCPTDGRAFMMQVYSPLSTAIDNETTDTWVYRIRKIITYKGQEYVQYVSSGGTAGDFTYGKWSHNLTSILTSAEYGDSLPSAGTAGRIFFKKV